MKISLEWLSDFIDFDAGNPQAIADRLTTAAGEVEEVAMQGSLLRHCVVGQVSNLRKHPGADKLSVCDVKTDQGTKKIVCGGTNLREGMLVAFAHVGARVKHGDELVTLAPVKIRGELSEGMICANDELDLQTMFPNSPEGGNRPIVDLSGKDYKVGTPLRDALGLTDTVLHIDNHAITNRPDLFSHVGVARELVAMGLATWKKPKAKKKPVPAKAKTPFTVHNDTGTLVPFYRTSFLEIQGEGTTPDWMRRRLEATGWRCISLAVDITNYVMMEQGMPLHAFDAGDFRGDLHIRLSKKGEKMTTLDKAERVLPDGVIVINDDEGIFDLFGIMGGLRTSTKHDTKYIFLQGAIPDPVTIRRAAIGLGHRTDAATVYEKGVPFCTSITGVERATELFLELCPGARLAAAPVEWGTINAHKPLKIDEERISRAIGIPVEPAKVKTMLNDLGFSVTKTGHTLSITPPEWRNDVKLPADIIEEVARIYGYDRIPALMPAADVRIPVRDQRIHMVRDALKQKNYVEMLHLAFNSAAQLSMFGFDVKKSVAIENPIGEETSRMRMSLLPSLALTAADQLKNSRGMLRLYEVGHVFSKGNERNELCMLVAAKGKTTLMDDPMLHLKADMRHAFAAMGYDIDVTQTAEHLPAYAHPGRSGTVTCNGKTVGMLTELNPQTRTAAGLPFRTACAVIDWEAVTALTPATRLGVVQPAFPSVVYDETVPHTSDTVVKKLIAKLAAADPLLKSVEIVNLYQKENDRTLTLRFTYRADDRTLKQEESEAAHAKVLTALKN